MRVNVNMVLFSDEYKYMIVVYISNKKAFKEVWSLMNSLHYPTKQLTE